MDVQVGRSREWSMNSAGKLELGVARSNVRTPSVIFKS